MEKSSVRSFRDLEVWQRAMDLASVTYRLTQTFPREEIFGLASQLRRSAVSISSNVAEGQGRSTTREFKQFLSVARGSACELQTQLQIARELELGNSELLDEAEKLANRVGQMLTKLSIAIRSKLAAR